MSLSSSFSFLRLVDASHSVVGFYQTIAPSHPHDALPAADLSQNDAVLVSSGLAPGFYWTIAPSRFPDVLLFARLSQIDAQFAVFHSFDDW